MKIEELKEGLESILNAANEKLNGLCEQVGIEPDDPRLTDEVDAESAEGEDEGKGAEGEEGGGAEDGNTMPSPENLGGEGGEGGEGAPPPNGMDMAAAQAGVEGGAMPPTEIPPQAQEMPGGMPPGAEGEMPPPEAGGGMSPEEEEMMKQMQQQQPQ